jgi:hypothetical protein
MGITMKKEKLRLENSKIGDTVYLPVDKNGKMCYTLENATSFTKAIVLEENNRSRYVTIALEDESLTKGWHGCFTVKDKPQFSSYFKKNKKLKIIVTDFSSNVEYKKTNSSNNNSSIPLIIGLLGSVAFISKINLKGKEKDVIGKR